MTHERKQQILYVVMIMILYAVVRNIVERSMDGSWIALERQWTTFLEGLVVGVVLLFIKSGKNDGKMPN